MYALCNLESPEVLSEYTGDLLSGRCSTWHIQMSLLVLKMGEGSRNVGSLEAGKDQQIGSSLQPLGRSILWTFGFKPETPISYFSSLEPQGNCLRISNVAKHRTDIQDTGEMKMKESKNKEVRQTLWKTCSCPVWCSAECRKSSLSRCLGHIPEDKNGLLGAWMDCWRFELYFVVCENQ